MYDGILLHIFHEIQIIMYLPTCAREEVLKFHRALSTVKFWRPQEQVFQKSELDTLLRPRFGQELKPLTIKEN